MSKTPAPAARRPAAGHSARRRSRELALQGLYQWLVAGGEPAGIESHLAEVEDFEHCDRAHFELLLQGCIAESGTLDERIAAHIDRRIDELSPVEHAVLLIGSFELGRCIDIPYKVVINEAVELAKSFGGTDGHKFVNGVLDRAAAQLRRPEVEHQRRR